MVNMHFDLLTGIMSYFLGLYIYLKRPDHCILTNSDTQMHNPISSVTKLFSIIHTEHSVIIIIFFIEL